MAPPRLTTHMRGREVRYNKRIDPMGPDGLTSSQQGVALQWSEIVQELPRLATAIEKQDFVTLAVRVERLARLADYLRREAQAADRAPAPDRSAVIAAVDPAALDSPVGRALHPGQNSRG